MSTLDPIRPVSEAAVNTIADKVGNLVGTLWDYSLGLVVNIIFLSRKADEVAGEIEKLEARWKDLEDLAEDEARKPSNELSGWMRRVSSLATDASNFQKSFEDQSFCITRLRLGYDAVELLRQAKKLTEEGRDFPPVPLLRPRGPDPVQQVPSEISRSALVGGEGALRRVESYIMGDGVGIIGIYGMGGVGKTTLLKIINNEFLHGEAECIDKFHGEACRHKFEVIIWVTVSRDVQISTIQKSIADRLGLKWPLDAPKDMLFDKLLKKRFVLLLDDVWEKLNLVEIGIPFPKYSKNKSKILFTTRSEHVCGQMDADEKVKIDFLDDQSSWDLFRSKFGREAAVLNDTVIEKLAKEVVRRCGGLPIVLITVGWAMSSYAQAAGDWEYAITQLDECAKEIPGMEEAVLKSLKFSFDKLKNEALRNCLLYCALFPEDYAIPKEEIINYWICEGFLDDERSDEYDIERTRRRGNVLIRELQNACLLEEAAFHDYLGRERVMLQDTVRDMALWIAGGDFGVLAGSVSNDYSLQILKLRTWESARRISLFKIWEVEEPPSPSRWTPSFPNLTTLLWQGRHSENNVPKGLFSFTSMPALRVFDLTYADFSEFPIEITSLISLQYLCLIGSFFDSLPVELGNLTNLRYLILRSNALLRSIPREAISRLSRLQVLDMWDLGYDFDDDDDTRQPPQLKMSDLAKMGRLRELHLPRGCSSTSLGVIIASPLLRRCTRSLCARGPHVAQFGRLSNLDLTWVGRLPGLERLHVGDSPELREVLRLEGGGHDDLIMTSSFSKLKQL